MSEIIRSDGETASIGQFNHHNRNIIFDGHTVSELIEGKQTGGEDTIGIDVGISIQNPDNRIPAKHFPVPVQGLPQSVSTQYDDLAGCQSILVILPVAPIFIDSERHPGSTQLFGRTRRWIAENSRIVAGAYPCQRAFLKIYRQVEERHELAGFLNIPHQLAIDIRYDVRQRARRGSALS